MSNHPPNFEKRIEQYVKLRDEIKRLDDEHKSKMKPYRDTLEQLNGVILQGLQATNSDSAATAAGTAYRTTKPSASIADATAFWSFVTTQGYWDLLDKRANITAVKDYIEQQEELAKSDPTIKPGPPPGINYTTKVEVGVRRK